jgi:hypothetical protein
MKKIKTVFKIDRESGYATDKLMDGADWVLEGKGIATLKVDGTACLVKDGQLYKRFDKRLKSPYSKLYREGKITEVSPEMFNTVPENSIPCEEKPDPITHHHPHWVLCDKKKPEDKFHIEALERAGNNLEDGTYELIGHKIQNNPYNLTEVKLVKHGSEILDIKDRSLEGIKEFLTNLNGEGIVFYNEVTGDMKKIRKKDFEGLVWMHEDARTVKERNKNKFK